MIFPRKNNARRGLTLLEVVVALGIIGFALPVIIAATGSTANARRDAEAETRTAWLTRHIQRQILAKWSVATPPVESQITTNFHFPINPADTSEAVLFFDREGTFLSVGTPADFAAQTTVPDAVFAAKATATYHAQNIAIVTITFSQPAKLPLSKRSKYEYKYLTTRQGNL